jgi:CheY-like chemotaxis protein
MDLSTLPRGTNTILIVEEDAGLRVISSDLLKGLGYQIYQARNGPEALAFLQREHDQLGPDGIDLLLTDVEMPEGMTGTDLAQLTRVRIPNIKVLFTAPSTEAAKARLGSDDKFIVMSRPYQLDTLAHRVRDVLDG